MSEEAENAILDQKRLGTLIIDLGLFIDNQVAEEIIGAVGSLGKSLRYLSTKRSHSPTVRRCIHA